MYGSGAGSAPVRTPSGLERPGGGSGTPSRLSTASPAPSARQPFPKLLSDKYRCGRRFSAGARHGGPCKWARGALEGGPLTQHARLHFVLATWGRGTLRGRLVSPHRPPASPVRRLGEELGRGAYGQVYRGMDTRTGQHVAIKQLSLERIPSDALQVRAGRGGVGRRPAARRRGGQARLELARRPALDIVLPCPALPCPALQGIMNEVELLRNLNPRNIVKYLGSFRSKTHLVRAGRRGARGRAGAASGANCLQTVETFRRHARAAHPAAPADWPATATCCARCALPTPAARQYIILEYMENGALSTIIKANKFGPFPESLVAVYTQQVLQARRRAGGQGG